MWVWYAWGYVCVSVNIIWIVYIYIYTVFILPHDLWAPWVCGLSSFILEFLANITSSIYPSLFFFSLWYFDYYIPYILKFSYSFWMLCSIFFFNPLFSLYFSLGVICWPIFKLTDSSAVSSLLVSPSKACFISVTVFVISNTSLWFFLSFHLSAYIIHLFLHVVHCFLFFSMLILVI